MEPLVKDVLIIGAGITGMQAALDLADKGYQVALVDKQASVGGVMVKLDKTFPTNDCSICTAAPKMVEVSRHPNVDLLTYSEVEQVIGSEGNFHVSVWKRTNYIDPSKCTGCGDCAAVCPIEVTNRFDERLSSRKAVYIQFPQAVPSVYTIDYEHCVGCGACDRVCEAGAITFLKASQEIQLEVGSIIVATGFDVLEPLELRREYGYGKYKNVITALQYERLLSSSGPTIGKVLRPSDGTKPERIGWIQCVGSRSEQHGFPYCSRICCMYATKEAAITVENNPDIQTSIFYMDLRAYGKDFQQYYQKAENMGVRYIRSRPSHVYENPDNSITLVYEDTLSGEMHEEVFDMLVLSTAVIPSPDNRKLANVLGIEVDEHGFFLQKDILLEPMKSTRDGIFLAGCAQGPKDIPDSIAQASGAACKAVIPIKDRPRSTRREQVVQRDVLLERPRIGVFVCNCGKNIGGFVDVEEVTQTASNLPNVVFAEQDLFACSEDTQKRLKEAIAEHNLNRVIVAACSPITHGMLFQQTCEEAGLNQYLFEMANIRNQCSWVHSDNRELATHKAVDLIEMATAKASHLVPLHRQEIEVTQSCLVIGGGIAGIKAALNLADMGIDVYLVEREPALGGRLRQLHTLFPSDKRADEILQPLLQSLAFKQHIKVFLDTDITSVEGYVGNFKAELVSRPSGITHTITAGTIVVATGFQEIDMHGIYGYGQHKHIITQTELEQRLKDGTLGTPKNVVMINCAGAMNETNPYCCRIGCGVSVKNARLIQESVPGARLFMLYQDLRMFGKYEEEYFANVLNTVNPTMIRYTAEQQPEVSVRDDKIFVTVFDPILKDHVEIETDLLVLTAQTQGDIHTSKLKQMLKISADAGGFYNEAHAKIRPLDFATEGIYLCGSAHFPKNLPDAIAQAEGAASRAAIPVMVGKVDIEPTIATVNDSLCVGCGLCVTICPYNAIEMDAEKGVARITDVLCKGCGACVSACPSGASQQQHFTDTQMLSMISTAWEWEGT
jgi:heterodisulfide reductase subunit A